MMEWELVTQLGLYRSEQTSRYVVFKNKEGCYLIDTDRFYLGYISPYLQQKISMKAMEINEERIKDFKSVISAVGAEKPKKKGLVSWVLKVLEIAFVIVVIAGLAGFYDISEIMNIFDGIPIALILVIFLILLKVILSIIDKILFQKRTGIVFNANRDVLSYFL